MSAREQMRADIFVRAVARATADRAEHHEEKLRAMYATADRAARVYERLSNPPAVEAQPTTDNINAPKKGKK